MEFSKPPCLAFKIESEAIKLSEGLGQFFEKQIVKVTGGRFCHVATWMAGPINYALCHESMEPGGTRNTYYDLSQPQWELVKLPFINSSLHLGWALGDCGRPYGLHDIAALATGVVNLARINTFDRICSEDMFYMCKDIFMLRFPMEVIPGMVAPDGHPKNGWGLYELVKDALAKIT